MKHQKYIGKESDFQISAIRYLDSCGILCNHSANEIKANVQYYVKRAKMGVKTGFPDISAFVASDKYNGLFIELKVGYNKPSPEQMAWLEHLNNRIYLAFWTNSFDELMCVVDLYLSNKTIKLNDQFRVIYE